MSAIAGKLRSVHDDDHERGCSGRFYQCSCGYDAEVLDALDRGASEIERLTRELTEARAQTNAAVLDALEMAERLVEEEMTKPVYLQNPAKHLRILLARLDAEEPKP